MATKKALPKKAAPTKKKVAPPKKVVAKTMLAPAFPAAGKRTSIEEQIQALEHQLNVRAKMVTVNPNVKSLPSVTDRRTSLDKQIEALESQMRALDVQTVQELKVKISDTKKILRGYELHLEELTGKRSAAPKKARRG